MMRVAALALLSLFHAGAAMAADLTVTVRTAAGKPVADAVVAVYPAAGVPAQPIRFAWPLEVDQRNMQFDPFVLIVPVGADVAFPNRDAIRHHVYSFSPIKTFELKLYGRDESRSVRFDKIGVVALGCNIHDSMVAYLKVVDTPFAAKTGPTGTVVLRGLPAGASDVRVWHPYLRAPDGEVRRATTLRDAGAETFTVELRTPPSRRQAY